MGGGLDLGWGGGGSVEVDLGVEQQGWCDSLGVSTPG